MRTNLALQKMYSDQLFNDFAEKMKGWIKERHRVWGFFNNDIDGHAFRNAARLKALVE